MDPRRAVLCGQAPIAYLCTGFCSSASVEKEAGYQEFARRRLVARSP